MTGASNVWNDARDPSTPFQVWLVIHVQGLSAIKVSIKFVVYLHPLMGHYEDIKTMQNVEKGVVWGESIEITIRQSTHKFLLAFHGTLCNYVPILHHLCDSNTSVEHRQFYATSHRYLVPRWVDPIGILRRSVKYGLVTYGGTNIQTGPQHIPCWQNVTQ